MSKKAIRTTDPDKVVVNEADVSRILEKPYTRMVIPEKDGTYRAEMLEFTGCLSTGETAAEAIQNLDDAAMGWLHASLERRQFIPEPIENTEFSGRLALRMPRSLHKKAVRQAEIEGVSLNQFVVTAIALYVGEQSSERDRLTVTGRINFTFMPEGILTIGGDSTMASVPHLRLSAASSLTEVVLLPNWSAPLAAGKDNYG